MADDLLGFPAITAALVGTVELAAKGVAARDFHRFLGYEHDGVRQAAVEAADEEWATLPGMPVGVSAEGRLRKLRALSRSQREAVHEALVDTFELAFYTAVVLEQARRLDGGADG